MHKSLCIIMSCTIMYYYVIHKWLHTLSTRENWVAQFKSMNGYRQENARFIRGLLQLLFPFLSSKTCK